MVGGLCLRTRPRFFLAAELGKQPSSRFRHLKCRCQGLIVVSAANRRQLHLGATQQGDTNDMTATRTTTRRSTTSTVSLKSLADQIAAINASFAELIALEAAKTTQTTRKAPAKKAPAKRAAAKKVAAKVTAPKVQARKPQIKLSAAKQLIKDQNHAAIGLVRAPDMQLLREAALEDLMSIGDAVEFPELLVDETPFKLFQLVARHVAADGDLASWADSVRYYAEQVAAQNNEEVWS